MSQTKQQKDQALRNYAMENLRSALYRLREGDLHTGPRAESPNWREEYLDKAHKWAVIVQALPEPPLEPVININLPISTEELSKP